MNEDAVNEDAVNEDAVNEDAVNDDSPLRPPVPRPRANGSMLAAAMIGLAIGLGMEPRDEPTEQVQAAEPSPDGLDLDFGSLPPLDPPG